MSGQKKKAFEMVSYGSEEDYEFTKTVSVYSILLNGRTNISAMTDPSDENMVVEIEPTIKRDKWRNKLDFLLACIGFSVGLGNVWRFPYLCYKNGGGAFLFPYFISVVLGGIPVFFLEVALGQLTARGGIEAWNICPLLKGIGFAGMVIVFCLNCYYNVILAWTLRYLFASFTSVLPWSTCNNSWNTDTCVENGMHNLNSTLVNTTEPTSEYWEYNVLGISDGIEKLGTVKWDLALCLLLAWLIVYACICNGIKTSGRVMYVTATSPYILMFILLIRTCTLEGAGVGISYYLSPKWEKLLSMEVWSDAGTQIFFSYSISLGTLTALGSYNSFHHNSFRDCMIFAGINSMTSLLAGFVIFATLGNMAAMQGVKVEDVAESGPGLAFVVYPKALSTMPISPLWSILFFTMLLLLGLDSQFVGVEGLVTAISDLHPKALTRSSTKFIFIGVVCFISFLVGLVMVTNGGMYVFQLFDYYTGSRIILLVAVLECVTIGYIYGGRKFLDNLKTMYGFSIGYAPLVMWCIITPAFCLMLFVFSAIVYGELDYKRATTKVVYNFPKWSVILGWSMACSSILMVPVVAAYQLWKNPSRNLYEKIKRLFEPKFNDETLMHLSGGDINDLTPVAMKNQVQQK